MAASGNAKNNNSEVRIFANLDDLATEFAEYIAQLSEISVKERGFFTIALTGGSLIYLMRKLSEAPYDKTVDWAKWYVFWADERVVAKNHVDSNYKLTKDSLLSKVSILNSHIYSINDKLTVEEAAGQYEFVIRQLVKMRIIDVSEHNDCPKFDLILLELGSDGHIASLFPRHESLEHKMNWVTYITDSPEPPLERITFSTPVINSASNVAIAAIGDDKAMAVQLAVDRNVSFDAFSFPARLVNPSEGKLVWFIDEPAASFLNSAGADESKHFEI